MCFCLRKGLVYAKLGLGEMRIFHDFSQLGFVAYPRFLFDPYMDVLLCSSLAPGGIRRRLCLSASGSLPKRSQKKKQKAKTLTPQKNMYSL